MAEIKKKNPYDWFLYWLYEDTEFRADVDELDRISEELYANNPTGADFIDKYEAILDDKLDELCKKWDIAKDEFHMLDGSPSFNSFPALDFPFEFIEYKKNGDMVVKIPYDINRDDYIDAWRSVRGLLDTNKPRPEGTSQSRRRSADDTRLVYAVGKARLKGSKFSEIFLMYQNGNLDQYGDMPTNQFTSSDSLERYYNKYKPAYRPDR